MKRPILLLALLLGLVACQGRGGATKPTVFPYHVMPEVHEPRRVVVVPFYHGPEVVATADVVNEAMATALRELGSYEVARITPDQRDQIFGDPSAMLSNLNTESLRRFRERYHADAVLMGRIDHYDCYDPIAIGMETHLVSCRDGLTLWSATAHFDGSRSDIQNDLRYWYSDVVGSGRPTVGDWQLALQSPSLFARYTAERLTASIIGEDAATRKRYVR